jgi:NADH dehydrogenase
MKILLTGASGGLGSQLSAALSATGKAAVRALIHRQPLRRETAETAETAVGDLADPDSLCRAVHGVDTVVHLAARIHASRAEDYFRVNVEGTKNLIAACRSAGVRRLVYVSSAAAHPLGGAYSLSKWQAEERVRQCGLPWLILRPSEVYGPGSPDAIQKLIGWIDTFPILPVIGDGLYTLSPAYVDDVIGACVGAALDDSLVNEVFILAGPEVVTFNGLVDCIGRFLRKSPLRVHIPVAVARAVAEFSGWFSAGLVPDQISRLLCAKDFNIELARQRLGYRPRRLEEGLKGAVAPTYKER